MGIRYMGPLFKVQCSRFKVRRFPTAGSRSVGPGRWWKVLVAPGNLPDRKSLSSEAGPRPVPGRSTCGGGARLEKMLRKNEY